MSIIGVVILYVVSWFVFATYDFKGSDTIVAYSLYQIEKPKKNDPIMNTLAPTV